MSTVLAMRFNEKQAVLIADESTWHLGHVFGYRRTNYGDALASLFSPEDTERTGLTAVYAGLGFPSFQAEVARRARQRLAGLVSSQDGVEKRDNRGVARTVYEAFLDTHGRMIDDKLRFHYGFGRHALNARQYRRGGETREIAMAPVVSAARAIAGGSARGNAYARIYSNYGFVLTSDSVRGVEGYYVNPKGHSIGFATPVTVLGEGSEVASHVMSQFLGRRTLERRRAGFSLEEGLYLALRMAAEIRFSVGKMGGYFQIVMVDAERGVREFVSDEAHLAAEVMRAHLWGFVERPRAEELIQRLLLRGDAVDEVEQEFFEGVEERALLERYLIGFKPVHAPSALPIDPPVDERPEGGDVR